MPQPRARVCERLANDGRYELEVPARRDLWHDAAVARVDVRLRGDDVGADLAPLGDERRRCLVAGGLDAEDQPLAALRQISRACGARVPDRAT